jgi:hypothetical protein
MKYLILLVLMTSCSSTKIKKEEVTKIHYKNPTQKYFQRKLINRKTQIVLTNI